MYLDVSLCKNRFWSRIQPANDQVPNKHVKPMITPPKKFGAPHIHVIALASGWRRHLIFLPAEIFTGRAFFKKNCSNRAQQQSSLLNPVQFFPKHQFFFTLTTPQQITTYRRCRSQSTQFPKATAAAGRQPSIKVRLSLSLSPSVLLLLQALWWFFLNLWPHVLRERELKRRRWWRVWSWRNCTTNSEDGSYDGHQYSSSPLPSASTSTLHPDHPSTETLLTHRRRRPLYRFPLRYTSPSPTPTLPVLFVALGFGFKVADKRWWMVNRWLCTHQERRRTKRVHS